MPMASYIPSTERKREKERTEIFGLWMRCGLKAEPLRWTMVVQVVFGPIINCQQRTPNRYTRVLAAHTQIHVHSTSTQTHNLADWADCCVRAAALCPLSIYIRIRVSRSMWPCRSWWMCLPRTIVKLKFSNLITNSIRSTQSRWRIVHPKRKCSCYD